MPNAGEDVRQSLWAHDPEFRSLAEEHSRCESQLEQILESSYRSSDDLAQEATLKKRTLQLKDRMEWIIAHHHQMASR